MRISVKKSLPFGTVTAPPSKSFAHRGLICGGFSQKSIIRNISFSEDIKATLSCLENLGADISLGENYAEIKGIDREKIKEGIELYCNESGSTLRFLIPICLLFDKEIILKGTEKLFSRPLDEYRKLCENNNFLFEKGKDCLTIKGCLKAGDYEISSEKSSQFVSGLLTALSLANGKSTVNIVGEIQSKPYIDITVDTINKFGVKIENDGNKYTVYGKNFFENRDFTVEDDCSNAAYLEAFSLLNTDVLIRGAANDSLQGDIVYKKMFCGLKNGERSFNLKNCPDLAPVMFSAACLFGVCEFEGTSRLKFKESDRSRAMQEELNKFGVFVEVSDDKVIINPQNIKTPTEVLSSHNDHRIVMALCLLCAKYGGVIEGAEAVNKSFPDFFEKLKELNIGYDVL